MLWARSARVFIAFPSRSLYYIGWNNKRAPFDDVSVRKALTLAIDRAEIIKALLFGYGTPAVSTVPPWSPLFPTDIAPMDARVIDAIVKELAPAE